MAGDEDAEEELDSEDETERLLREEYGQDDLKSVCSVEEDEDTATANRAEATAAAGGSSPCAPLPEATSEVDFDVTNPPLTPVVPPSDHPILNLPSQMNWNDVLCGSGRIWSQEGNRRHGALIRAFSLQVLQR